MSDQTKRPIVVVIAIIALVVAVVFGIRQYRAVTGVPKDKTIQMSPDALREAMRRDN